MAKQMNADEIAGQLAGLVEKIEQDTRQEIVDEFRSWMKTIDEHEKAGLQAAIDFIVNQYVLPGYKS